MAKQKNEDEITGPVPPMPDAPKPKGWGAAADVYKFVCAGCNQEKRGQKMLDGKCEACYAGAAS